MTAENVSVILADALAAAGEHRWDRLRDFAASLPDDRDRAILLLASEETEPGPLARWLGSVDPSVPVRADSLEALTGHPAQALRVNRVIVALRCGELLTPEAVESGALVVGRPAGSYMIVITGAELIGSDEDLALVQRGVWRLLLSDHGDEWTGQNLAEHGCVLWNDAEAADFLAGRLLSDRESLVAWLRADVGVTDGLRADRVAYALDMAGKSDAVPPDPDELAITARRSADARSAVAKGRRRILGCLDAAVLNAEREITSSLAMLEQDLLAGIPAFIAQHRGDAVDVAAARELIGRYVGEGLQRWLASAGASLDTQSDRISDNLRDLIDGMDWHVIDRAGGPHPRVMLTAARLDAVLSPGEALTPEIQASAKGQLSPGPANVVIGGAIGASVGTVLGAGAGLAPGLLAGAVGGLAVNRYLTDRTAEQIAGKARKLVARRVAIARDAAVARFREDAARQRTAVIAAFDDLDRAVDAYAKTPEPDEPDPGMGALAELRERLRLARSPSLPD
jgi:hypothetical protein